MKCTLAELRYKEVIDIVDGSRYGFVGDVELDMESGTVKAIVIPGRLRWFGPVSYTHLDVYKRQHSLCAGSGGIEG